MFVVCLVMMVACLEVTTKQSKFGQCYKLQQYAGVTRVDIKQSKEISDLHGQGLLCEKAKRCESHGAHFHPLLYNDYTKI